MTIGLLPQLIVSGLALGSIYALVALGFTLIFATVRVVNFAQGELVMIAALTGYSFQVVLGLPLALAAPLATLVTVVVALLIERVAVYPLRGLQSGVAWVVSTLAAGMILRSAATAIWGREPRAVPSVLGLGRVEVGGVAFVPHEAMTLAVAVATMLLLELARRKHLLGKAMRAAAFNLDAAKLVGINVTWMSLLAFGASAMLASLAGLLISPLTGASAEMGTLLGIKGFAAAAAGGLGTFSGALAGGLALGLIEVLASGLLWPGSSEIVAFALLLAVLLIRPSGLFSSSAATRV